MGPEDFGLVALQGISMGGGFGGAFFALKWFAQFIANRHDKREERLEQRSERLIIALERRVDDVMDRLDKTEKALDECKAQHRESEAKVARLEAILQGYGDAKQHAALIIAAEKMERKG